MAEVPCDLCIRARDGDTLQVVGVVWRLHSGMVASWAEFHRGTPPADLDLTNLDGQAARVFDDWCLHRPSWKDRVTAPLFGPCMELCAYLVVSAEFLKDLLSIAFDHAREWDWRDILPFLDLAPDAFYTAIVVLLLNKYEYGREGWWFHGFPVCNQRLLECMYSWLRTSATEQYCLTFLFFLDRTGHAEIDKFLESGKIRSGLMHIAIRSAGSRHRSHLINFWKANPAWASIALRLASTMHNKSHFVNALKKCSM